MPSFYSFKAPDLKYLKSLAEKSFPEEQFLPMMPQVAAPRKTVRRRDPFDFFGTLFTGPEVSEAAVNPMKFLNTGWYE